MMWPDVIITWMGNPTQYKQRRYSVYSICANNWLSRIGNELMTDIR